MSLELRMELAAGLGAAGLAGGLFARAGHVSYQMIAQTLAEQQFAHALPLLLYICAGLGTVTGFLVLVFKVGWSLFQSAKGTVRDIATEAVKEAVAAHRDAMAHDIQVLREDVAGIRGELSSLRRMMIRQVGDTPPPTKDHS